MEPLTHDFVSFFTRPSGFDMVAKKKKKGEKKQENSFSCLHEIENRQQALLLAAHLDLGALELSFVRRAVTSCVMITQAARADSRAVCVVASLACSTRSNDRGQGHPGTRRSWKTLGG